MITLTVRCAHNKREKIVGLIGQKQAYPLLLETRFGIHTFGVKFPIDVVILNDNHEVMDMFEKMSPNRVFVWNPKYKYVLELPNKTIKDKKIQIGSKIKLATE